ncbi:MAG: 50S ribosomal protein L7ae [Clostridia bacterium]|nr:50S ribosomal protein L7ae [Clostridia bacterium]
MNNKKILGLIGFAARARKICFGADSVELEIKKKKVYLVVIAEDASDRTKEKFTKLGKEYKIPIIIEGEIEILSQAIGKSNKAIIGIEEKNLAKEIQKIKNGGEDIG